MMGGNQKPPDAVYRWEVLCLNRADGKVLWKKTAAEHKPAIPIQAKNTYASETPAADAECVYAWFGPTGLFCYSKDGELRWKKELGAFKMQFGWGTGSSPIVDDSRVYVVCDNEERSFVAAFDKKTGNELWRKDRQEKSTWGTPYLWKNKLRTELVTGGSKKARSYDPATGDLLWELGGMSPGANATPTANDELLFVGTGGPFGDSPLYAVKAGAKGDVTLKPNEESNAGVAWSRKQAGPTMASPLVYDGYLYIVSQYGGFLTCFEAATGKPAYPKQRLSQAKGFTSSPWAYDGKIFCLDEEGQAFIIQAGSEFKLLGKNTIDEMFMASPAISGGALFLRGIDHLYCVVKK
jgi:outer membrane protein assembly factor BamB